MSLLTTFDSSSANQTFQLPTLFRIGADKKVHVWIISFNGEKLITCWERLDNYQKGVVQTSSRRVELNTRSIGLYEQALQEARAEYKRKKDKDGYNEQLIQHDIFTLPAMLCTKWDPSKNQIRRWPVWTMPKLDGIRCRIHIHNSKIYIMSRTSQEYIHLHHIREEFNRFNNIGIQVLQELYPTLSSYFRTDGEIYTLNLTFDQINGICRLTNSVSPNEHHLKYYMFDLMLTFDMTYDQRYALLKMIFDRHVAQQGGERYFHLIPVHVANNKQDILNAHTTYTYQGYEGVIIRRIGGDTEKEKEESYYKGSRCTAIYKFKTFNDDEGIIIGASCERGDVSRIVWDVRDKFGREFSVRPKGTDDYCAQLYLEYQNNPHNFINKLYRYRYQELTPDGKPRFPIGLGIVTDR